MVQKFVAKRELLKSGIGVLACSSTNLISKVAAQTLGRSRIIRQTVGDQHGNHVPLTAPLALGIATHPEGTVVPAIILNGDHHGGLYGTPIKSVQLAPDDYWSSFEIHTGIAYNRSAITYLELRSQLGEKVAGGNPSPAPPNQTYKADGVRVLEIGGWHGDWFGGIEVEYVESYRPSKVVDDSVSAILDYYVGPEEIETYFDERLTKLAFFEHVIEQTSETNTNANANGELADKFVRYSITVSSQTTLVDRTVQRQTVETVLTNGQRSKETIGSGMMGARVVSSALMQDSDGQFWIYPRLTPKWVKLPEDQMKKTLLGLYDFSNIEIQLGLHHENLPGGLRRLIA